MAKSTKPTLPDFDLARLRGFDPAVLQTDLGNFILLLAAVFNDLKGVAYVVERLRDAAPIANQDLAWRGQVSGMWTQTTRVMAGILYELMVVIKEHEEIVDSPEFRKLVAGLPSQWRSAWNRVQRIARSQDRVPNVTGADSQLLVRLRNTVGFHYSAKVVAKGYREHFSNRTKKASRQGGSLRRRFDGGDPLLFRGRRHGRGAQLRKQALS